MQLDDSTRLLRLAVSTAVSLLETQDGVLYPIARAIDADGRTAFFGAYNGMAPHPTRALEALRAALRGRPFCCTAVVYGVVLPQPERNALCVEFESLDAPAETIFVPFVITRPARRSARVITYAPMRTPGRNVILTRTMDEE